MFLAELWVHDVNILIEYLDDELINVRKIAFETASAINGGCKELEKNKKEEARLREKSRLLELRQEIEYLRKQIAQLSYQSKVRTAICVFEGIILVLSFFSKIILGMIICAAILLTGLVSLAATYLFIRKIGGMIAQACSHYGVIEANIKVFDYRELETIDLERSPYQRIRYDRADLAGPL